VLGAAVGEVTAGAGAEVSDILMFCFGIEVGLEIRVGSTTFRCCSMRLRRVFLGLP
jgi:hypothetical protein